MILSWLFLMLFPYLIPENLEEQHSFPIYEPFHETFYGEELIGSKEWIPFLLEKDPHLPIGDVESELRILFERHIQRGGIVIDYGAGVGTYTLFFANLVGSEGKVLSFESNPEEYRALFWNLLHSKIYHSKIFCFHQQKTLDELGFSKISFIYIQSKGKEKGILRGAEKTIRSSHPIVIINMLGGMNNEKEDYFLKRETDRNLQVLSEIGYNIQKISKNLYLATPHKL